MAGIQQISPGSQMLCIGCTPLWGQKYPLLQPNVSGLHYNGFVWLCAGSSKAHTTGPGLGV